MKRNLRYNVRELSYYILIGVIYDGMLLGDRIIDILDNYDINDADKSYIKRECTGVIENISVIDFYIKKFTSFNIKKISREIMTILRIGIYELLYMDRVPSYATINECVEITKKLSVSRYYNNQYR